MDASEYENIARLENKHWWYRGMATISMSLLKRSLGNTLKTELNILDAGCGMGGMFKHLATLGAPFGIDFSPLAVDYAHNYAPVARASITQLPFANSSFHIVTSFDVIYHRAVEDDIQAFKELYRVLVSGGKLLVRLPAFESLRGQHDEVVHTARRYSAQQLRTRLEQAGFRIEKLTYANMLLLPAIYLRRKFSSNHHVSDVELPIPVINRLLELILLCEGAIIKAASFPVGVSLLAVASKP
jgi:SAM-dependent methyltransferase